MRFGELYPLLMDILDKMLEGFSSIMDLSQQPFIDVINRPIDALPLSWLTEPAQALVSSIASWLTGGVTDMPFYVVLFGNGLFLLISFFVVKGIIDAVL